MSECVCVFGNIFSHGNLFVAFFFILQRNQKNPIFSPFTFFFWIIDKSRLKFSSAKKKLFFVESQYFECNPIDWIWLDEFFILKKWKILVKSTTNHLTFAKRGCISYFSQEFIPKFSFFQQKNWVFPSLYNDKGAEKKAIHDDLQLLLLLLILEGFVVVVEKTTTKIQQFLPKMICACLFHENSQQNLMLIFFVFVFWMRNFCFSYFPTKDSSSMLYLRRQDYFWSVGCLVWLFLLLLLVARFSFLSLNSEPR